MEHAPYPRLAVIRISPAPDRITLAPQIQDKHPVVRHGREQCLDLPVSPKFPFMVEQPPLHHPYCLRVNFLHCMIDLAAYLGKIQGIICRRHVLIECVRSVIMVCPIELCLLFKEHLPYLCKQVFLRVEDTHFREIDPAGLPDFRIRKPRLECRRDMTCERREHRSHSETPLGSKNPFLKILVHVHETLGQWTFPTVQIPHPEPVEICRSAEEIFEFLISESQPAVHSLPHRILSGDSQWHIDSVHCHEIDFPLPSVEIPPAHGVVEGAVIEIVPVSVRRSAFDSFLWQRQDFRQFCIRAAP